MRKQNAFCVYDKVPRYIIGRNELAVLGFIRVFPIVQTILQRAGDGFPLADMVGNESGCGYTCTSLI